jgi:hypothetical protein
MPLTSFLRRADRAVQDTKASVGTAAVIAVAAMVIALAALIVAVMK